jgi:Flp pilus assembly protein TadD
VATVSALDLSTVTLTDTAAARERGRLRGHRVPLRQLAFSPDGRCLASGGTRGTAGERRGEVKVWDFAAEGEVPRAPILEREWKDLNVTALAFSPDNQHLAVGGYTLPASGDREHPRSVMRVVDVGGGQETLSVEVADEMVTAVRFSPDGSRLAAVGFLHGTVLLRDLPSGREIRSRTGLTTAGDLAFTPDGARLAVGGRYLVKVLDARTAEELLALQPPLKMDDPGSCPKVAFSPDGQRLAALAGEDALCLWDARAPDPEAEAERTLAWHLDHVRGREEFARAFHLRPLIEREPPSTGLRQALARACTDIGDLDRAETNLAAALDREPDVAAHWVDRGAVASWRERWGQAAACYGRAVALEPARLTAWRCAAATLLLSGDTEGYRRLVARMRERFGESAEPEIVVLRARVEAQAPNSSPLPAGWMEQSPRPFLEAHGVDPVTLGRALYRAGHYGPAWRMLEAAMTRETTREGKVLGLPLLALCRARLGQTAEARQALQQAEAVTTCPPGIILVNWLEFLVLRREAQSLLGGPTAAPRK